MAMIKISQFLGMLPKVSIRLLPEAAASYASNIKLQSGTPEPLSPPGLYAPLSKTETIFLARNGTAASAWFAWDIDVNCVRVPLPADVEARFCWSGDGAPKVAKYSTALTGGGGVYPFAYYDLGVPVPVDKPSVSATGGVGSDVTRFYQYTFFSADGEESGPSPLSGLHTGKIDGTWAVSNMSAIPTSSGTGTATASTFTNAASARTWLRVGDEVAFGSAPGVFRTVTALPSSSSFSVAGDSIAAETTWARRSAWNTVGMTKRLYRTSGTTGFFALVADNITGTTYNDTLGDDAILGDELISVGWEPPPVGLKGLCVHSSGALAGFAGNILYFSEPLQPHAWVAANQLSASFDGVGIAAYGQSVVLATRGNPFIATGSEPANMTGETIDGVYPCLSKRSVVSIGNGVVYAADAGLAMVGSMAPGLMTESHYTRKEWALLNPETMECAVSSGRVYVKNTTDAGVTTVLVFDSGQLVIVGTPVDSMFSDVPSGELFIGTQGGAYLWDDQTQVRMSGSWRSKEFVFPKPVNLGAAKVDFLTAVSASEEAANVAEIAAAIATNAAVFATGDPGDLVNSHEVNVEEVNGSNFVTVPASISNSVIFNLYGGASRALLASKTINNNKVFRLPAGYKEDNFQVEIITQSSVTEVRVATTPDRLKDG